MAVRKLMILGTGGLREEIAAASLSFDDTNNRLGILTAAPTHSLTIGSTGTGLALYNTVDQTTNYERWRLYQSGNVLLLTSEAGGTGTIRGLQISGGNAGVGIGGAPLSGNALNVTGQANFNNNTYFQANVNCNGIVSANGSNPSSTNAYDLGSTSRIWNNLYVNKIYVTASGQSTQNGNGTSTAFTITHGLTGITSASKVFVTARSSAAVGYGLVSLSSTQITINYAVAPASGTGNLVWDWFIIP